MRRYQVVIDVIGLEEGIYAFIYWKKWISGQVLPKKPPDKLTYFERQGYNSSLEVGVELL